MVGPATLTTPVDDLVATPPEVPVAFPPLAAPQDSPVQGPVAAEAVVLTTILRAPEAEAEAAADEVVLPHQLTPAIPARRQIRRLLTHSRSPPEVHSQSPLVLRGDKL